MSETHDPPEYMAFCHTGKKRKYNLQTPWNLAGYRVYSSSYALLVAKGDYKKDELLGDRPDIADPSIIGDFKCFGHAINGRVDLSELDKLDCTPRRCEGCPGDVERKEKCSECDGRGVTTCYACDSEHECDCCDGTGETTTEVCDPASCIDPYRWPSVEIRTAIGRPHGLTFNVSVLKKIAKLPGLRVAIDGSQVDRLIFRFDHGFGLVMPTDGARVPEIILTITEGNVADCGPSRTA